MTAITAVLVLYLVRLGARLLPIAVGIGAVIGAAAAVLTLLRTGVRRLAFSASLSAICGGLGVAVEIASR